MIPYTEESYQLLHDGVRALSRVESNGIAMDTEYMDKAIQRVDRQIKHYEAQIRKTDLAKTWRQVFRAKTNLDSNDQLGKILFNHMGHTPAATTATGRPKTDEESLSAIDDPFVEKFLKIKKLKKARSTYLKGIQREIVDGVLHPSFNLHTVQTYRSSSDSPNFQNIPVRNPEIGTMIRKAFIPRPGRVLVEIDYSGIEVRIAACYHKDPAMVEYIEDPSRDMHRDMAAECYMLDEDEVTKTTRYCGKNMFVFPQFYGDWYIDCARSLWEAVSTMKLETKSGTPLKKHLREMGITELGDLDPSESPRAGTFERHLQQVEKRFWGERFPVYDGWKKRWYKDYQKKGWFLTLTGFIVQGFMKRNEVINSPVQGSAFHCLLWSLIQLVLVEIPKRKMETLIVGQIHDSIVADVPVDELDDYLHLAQEVMTTKLREHWDWINVPIEIEAEVTPEGGSWADKEEVEIK